MNELAFLRAVDDFYKFIEPIIPFSLPATFIGTILFVARPGFSPYFNERRRATADFQWVAMSLLSIAVLLWFSTVTSNTQLAHGDLERQKSALRSTLDNASVFNLKWCTPEYAQPFDSGRPLRIGSFCRVNEAILAQGYEIREIFRENRYQWHNPPMFSKFPFLEMHILHSHPDVEVLDDFNMQVLRYTEDFNDISDLLRRETQTFRYYVQITLIRWFLLHLTAGFGAIRLMRAYYDVKKAVELASE